MAYNIGGTAPIGLPATIRTLHSYTLQPNFSLGIDAYHPLSGKWGFVGGLHFENKGMKIDAGVKNYYMRIVRGGEELKGIFTGNVVTKVDRVSSQYHCRQHTTFATTSVSSWVRMSAM